MYYECIRNVFEMYSECTKNSLGMYGNLYVFMAFLSNAGGSEIIEVIHPSKPVTIGILYYGD